MARVQVALNVSDLETAVAFYERLLGTPPAKRRPGYANFAVTDPPLKLVLFEAPGTPERLNHLGIEVEHPEDVRAAEARTRAEGLAPVRDDGACCYARQEKVWIDGPDGHRWEVYTVLGEADELACAPEGCVTTTTEG